MRLFVFVFLSFFLTAKAQKSNLFELEKSVISPMIHKTEQTEYSIHNNKESPFCDYKTINTYDKLGKLLFSDHTSPCDSTKNLISYIYFYENDRITEVRYYSKERSDTISYLKYSYKDSMTIEILELDSNIQKITKTIITNLEHETIETSISNADIGIDSTVRAYKNGMLKKVDSFNVRNDSINRKYTSIYSLKSTKTQYYLKNKEYFSKIDSINAKGDIYKTIHSFPFEGVSMKFFEFIYDKNGNWIEKKYTDSKTGRIYKRRIIYF